MMRHKWLFWLPRDPEKHDSPASFGVETQACREWTPSLTALFDGEADEASALQARRHLIVCERCARAWLDWNQTRSLLISHSAPPPPPNLLWRVRLACRLGQPGEQNNPSQLGAAPLGSPQLSAQILARTTRQKPKPTFGAFLPSFVPRGLRLNAPFAGALAVGVFVMFLSRDLLIAPPSGSDARQGTVLSARVLRAEGQADAHIGSPSSRAEAPILAPHERHASPAPANPDEGVPNRDDAAAEGSLVSLSRARHERETLASDPIRPVSFQVSAPLPMLQAPRSFARAPRERLVHREIAPAQLADSPRTLPRPVASSPRIAFPTVVLASDTFETEPSSVSISAPRGGRSNRVALISDSPAPLRISAPRALPITMAQPAPSDDSGLDELDSTVQEYRATLSDDSDTSSNSDTGQSF